MAVQPQSRPRLAFGLFEVDAAAGQLRKRGIRVPLSGQPFRILLVLLAHPGELVTREQLREEVWTDATFVDFEHGLNAAINKLRRALGDSAENPRYIETQPGRGYRFIGTLERTHSTPNPSTGGAVIREGLPRRLGVGRWWLLAAAAACVAVSFAVVWRLHGPQAAMPPWHLTRLTNDAGISNSPALSLDGKLVAYSSDRSLDGERDLYIKQVAGGQPIRLTSDGAGNTTPDFSPDGSKIIFRSNRDGGGIYETPALGGEVRLVVRDGLNPKFSPDGSQVAYWVGTESVAAAVPGSGAVWVVPAAGGQPQRVGSNFTAASHPIWSPDGKHLLLIGYTSAKAFESSSIDWWLVATNGGDAVRTGAYEALVHAGLQARDPTSNTASLTPVPKVPTPGCWSATDKTVIFSIPSGDTQNLWEIGISPRTGKVSGVPKRLTTGVGNEVDPSCASGGALTFTNVETRREVWSLPFDFDSGTSKGCAGADRTRASQARNPIAFERWTLRSLCFRSGRASEHLGAGTGNRERVDSG